MGHSIQRVTQGVYHVNLSGRMSKQAMLQYRHDLHNTALQHTERVSVVIFTYGVLRGFDGEKTEQENIKEFLTEHPAEYQYSIHCGVNAMGRAALMFYHRIYDRSLPPDHYAKDMNEAVKLAVSLRDKIKS
jgi:hypothetical protein